MFGLTNQQMSFVLILVFLAVTKLLTSLMPDIFPPNEWLTYQVWTVAIFLFITFLPKNVGTAFK